MQTAEGLAVCHEQALFHGLLKPSNLMIDDNGQMRILDFGIGSLLAETEGESLVDTMSTANSVASGLDCASPESIMDPTKLTPLGDQYSLGCVLYFCLAGRYPFPDGSAAEKMMAQQFKQPTPLRELAPEAPEGLLAVVERLMQKAPETRYSNTGEVIEALKPFATGAKVGAPASMRPAADGAAKKIPPQVVAARAEPRLTTQPKVTSPRPEPRGEPRPERAPASLPTRQSLRGVGPGAATPQAAAPEPTPARAPVERPRSATFDQEPALTWEERLGPMGVAVAAVVLCVIAWLLTWKLF